MRNKYFTKSLTKKPFKVFTDLKVEKCINVEKAMAMKYQSHDKTVEREKNEEPSLAKRSPCQNHQKEESELKEHTLIHAIEEVKKKKSSKDGKKAIKVVIKSVQTTSKKWTNK